MAETPFNEDIAALFASPEAVEFASARRTVSFQPTEYTLRLLKEAVRFRKESGEPTTMGAIIETALLEHIGSDPDFERIQEEAVISVEFAHAREVRLAGRPDER